MELNCILNDLCLYRKGTGSFCVVEGFHALKHAYRFKADIVSVYYCEDLLRTSYADTVCDQHVMQYVQDRGILLDRESFDKIAPHGVRTGVLAVARRRDISALSILDTHMGKIVVLEDPRDLNNLGAVIRVLAARGGCALLVSGDCSPWHVRTIRSGAGLQWALPIACTTVDLVFENRRERRAIACTDEGESMYTQESRVDDILFFGTEREGISSSLREACDRRVGIPMQKGVSSMNLATSVAAFVYGQGNLV